MGFETEWAEVKRETSARMELASAHGQAGSPSGGGDLSMSPRVWGSVASTAGAVRGDIRDALGKLDKEQSGIGGGAIGGLASASSLQAVHRSWETRINLLLRECGELEDKLRKSADAYYTTEGAITDAFEEQRTRPREPAASGRPSSGDGGDSPW